ncbi:MAG: hypothetical protein KatS3mg129_2299 [Leptospiraceae bacterium]|nr:MAG: hypothetical protein KatS3mg129_2299 [Leptospiraceae bacterium]
MFLHSGEEYILKRDITIYYWNDENTRWTKITLWSLSLLTYINALQKSKQLKESDNWLFQDSKEAEKRFNFARNLFYLMFSTTIGFEFYISYRAYQIFGYDSIGNNLNIPNRKKIDSSILFQNHISLYYKKTF